MARTSNDIRSDFLRFFEERGHRFVPSSSLLPADDPTLLFANAGMNQFKAIFLGQEKRDYTRAVNTQKCIRAGGKHNDLEDVGHDCYHHTFFEMLGNWSFGDYFKEEAIAWAWELLTKVWGLPEDKLCATYFAGTGPNDSPEERDLWGKLSAAGIGPDTEAAELWRKTASLPRGQIIPGSVHDNFWAPGDSGPCGPCSEIHFDFGPACCDGKAHPGKACAVNVSGCGRFIELWNLVFIQFNRDEGGKLDKLPARHVDTGMGFERICRWLQGKRSNYATDLFVPIIKQIETMTDHCYGQTSGLSDRFDVTTDNDIADVACRVIADHARCLTFAIADGVIPSNEGRGYVLRRILRRAARYGRQYLKIEGPFLCKLVPTIVELMGGAFGELRERGEYVAQTVQAEEESFGRTLDRGIDLFRENVAETLKRELLKKYPDAYFRKNVPTEEWIYTLVYTRPGDKRPQFVRYGCFFDDLIRGGELSKLPNLSGETAFDLYATYGFPVDLTQIMGRELGMAVDMEGFQREMERHREISGAGEKFKAEAIANLPSTDDSPKYVREAIGAKVLGWVIDGQFVTDGKLETRTKASVVLDRTNFYAEQGGQVGDTGRLTWEAGEFAVEDVKLAGGCILHEGVAGKGCLKVGQLVRCEVDSSRMDTMRNHTATHLLNWALRKVLGDHVNQAGSVVAPDRLRFDFSHNKAVTDEELIEVERLVNERILADEKVVALSAPLAEATKIPGVRAVFGEKYPDPVRVIAIGTDEPLVRADAACAVEFCGGTHLERTGQVGLFKITSEESVAKGVRRITALTGRAAVEYVQQIDGVIRRLSGALRASAGELPDRLAAMQEELKRLRKRAAAAPGQQEFAVEATVQSSQGPILIGRTAVADPQAMRGQCDHQRQKGAAAIFIGAAGDDKVTLIAMVSQELAKAAGISASEWVKAVAPVIGGSGGGKPTLAQAGGKDVSKLADALAAAAAWVRDKAL